MNQSGGIRFSLRFVGRLAWAPAAVAAAALVFSQRTPAPLLFPADDGVISLRIRFGVGDGQPAQWDGELAAENGEVLALRNWRPRPGDRIDGTSRWTLATKWGPNFVRRPVETEQVAPPQRYLWHAGLIVDAKGPQVRLVCKTVQGEFAVRAADIPATGAATFLDGRVAVDRVATGQTLSTDDAQGDFAAILGGEDEVWAAWVSYRNKANEVQARRFDGRAWGEVHTVTARPSDVFLTKLGRDGQGRVWAVWSAQENGDWDLFGRRFDGKAWSAVERLTNEAGPDIYHSLAADSRGGLWLVWQAGRAGQFDILERRLEGDRWSEPAALSRSRANDWAPAIAAGPAGDVYVAWDTYDKGNYDVVMRRYDGTRWLDPVAVADTPRFEANVSLACDRQGRVWAAWNESGFQWGKDTGFLVRKPATALYFSRWMAVAVWDGARWFETAANIEESLPPQLRGYNDLPLLQMDAAGRPWVFFRHRMQKFADTPPDSINHRAAWETWGAAYDGERWTAPQFVPFSQGRTDTRAGFAAGPGGRMFGAWPTDNRDYEDFLFRRAQVYGGPLPGVAGTASPARLKARIVPKLTTWTTHDDEPGDLARIRAYEIRSGGKVYRIYRGDTHRHTEFSFDGNNDGSLLDLYRYALDAGGLDFLSSSDHNNNSGPDLEYVNYLCQQSVDLFRLERSFMPIYGYERSVPYPNGHRNLLFTTRGIPTLPIPAPELKGAAGAGKLYDYLRANKGIAISHTSASNMGTDWRDNDGELEPLVEIYQGDRVSAEYEGAPKAAYTGNPTIHPGGFRPAGYVWNAWAKGYKLGVQASSDHLSTHLSYACALAADFTREGLVDAMRRRHSYGATDNIVLDYRMEQGGKEYLQGDITAESGPVTLRVKVIGTRPVRQIDVVKNNRFVHNRQPMAREVEFEYRDPDPGAGESYYYVRVIQVDDQMAWSSPVWIGAKGR